MTGGFWLARWLDKQKWQLNFMLSKCRMSMESACGRLKRAVVDSEKPGCFSFFCILYDRCLLILHNTSVSNKEILEDGCEQEVERHSKLGQLEKASCNKVQIVKYA